MDFLHDALANGRKLRTLSIEDACTREMLAIEVDTSLPALRVVRVLERLRLTRGMPERIVIDYGTEFNSKALDKWAYQNKIALHFITPGRPMENGYIESFHGKFREECLNQHWFLTLEDARQTIEAWRVDYNRVRPHSSLGYLTPEEFATDYANVESRERFPLLEWSAACSSERIILVDRRFSTEIATIGIDLSKTSFHVIGLDGQGEIVLRRKCSRKQLLHFTSNRQRMLIGMEACGGAHFLGRALRAQGHDARLMAAQFVKGHFVNRTRTTIWMRWRLPRQSSDQRCASFPSRPTISSICRRCTGCAIAGLQGAQR